MSDYYYNLPNDIILYIESYLPVSPIIFKNNIENLPRKYKRMLDTWGESKFIKLDKYGKYPICWRERAQEEIDKKNEEIKQIRTNMIIFFIEYDIKAIPKNGVSSMKAKKNGLIKRRDEGFLLGRIISSSDHVRHYTRNDKKHIIISSPYTDDNTTREEHFKYGFKKYHSSLYNNEAYTYYLILE